jgi:hypothetical protein
MYLYPLHVDTQESDQTYGLLQYLIQVLMLVGLRMLDNNQVEPVFYWQSECSLALIPVTAGAF